MKTLVCKITVTDSEFGSNVELQTVNWGVNREVFKMTSRCRFLIHKHSYIKNQLLKHLGRFQIPRGSLVCSLSENNTSLLPSKLWVCSTSNNANSNKRLNFFFDTAWYYHDNDCIIRNGSLLCHFCKYVSSLRRGPQPCLLIPTLLKLEWNCKLDLDEICLLDQSKYQKTLANT